MKKIKFAMQMDLVKCEREEVFEFEDDVTDEELEEELKEWAWNWMDIWYEEVDSDELGY